MASFSLCYWVCRLVNSGIRCAGELGMHYTILLDCPQQMLSIECASTTNRPAINQVGCAACVSQFYHPHGHSGPSACVRVSASFQSVNIIHWGGVKFATLPAATTTEHRCEIRGSYSSKLVSVLHNHQYSVFDNGISHRDTVCFTRNGPSARYRSTTAGRNATIYMSITSVSHDF